MRNHVMENLSLFHAYMHSQHNTPFNAETKGMKRILDTKYSKADIKTITEISTHLDPKERNELYTLLKKYESFFYSVYSSFFS